MQIASLVDQQNSGRGEGCEKTRKTATVHDSCSQPGTITVLFGNAGNILTVCLEVASIPVENTYNKKSL